MSDEEKTAKRGREGGLVSLQKVQSFASRVDYSQNFDSLFGVSDYAVGIFDYLPNVFNGGYRLDTGIKPSLTVPPQPECPAGDPGVGLLPRGLSSRILAPCGQKREDRYLDRTFG